VLPISWAGLALMLLGVGLFVIDAHVTTHGALTVAGLISLVVGSLMLFRNAPSPYHASAPLLISVAIVLGGAWAFAISKAVGTRRLPVAVGAQRMVGEVGEYRGAGMVFVNGELWQARGSDRLRKGQKVRVDHVDPALVLDVEPLDTASA
jgi:membrane-bound serine protease (ClpP class)